MSLWADYVRECGQMQIIEHEWGFITYEITGEEVWTGDAYIIPSERKSGKIHELVAQLWEDARQKKCKFFCARISRKSLKSQEALVTHLRAGCFLTSMDDDYYYVKKPIEG